ncbi:uncharacterized protein LOC143220295 [Lasioglossum baleicum]|uniref:uncharacterized protein LOC143220295 n=1 Tax=Lasioglossum baleicum TaxID=434251 RepID=UPI003FCDF1E3
MPSTHNLGVIVALPNYTAAQQVTGKDDAEATRKVVKALVKKRASSPCNIRYGQIRTSLSGLLTIWVKCPIAAARTTLDSGRIRMGWVSARVQALEARRHYRYKCLELRHARARWPTSTDRSAACFRCG